MSEAFLQPISILVIEDDPGDFGLIRTHLGGGVAHDDVSMVLAQCGV